MCCCTGPLVKRPSPAIQLREILKMNHKTDLRGCHACDLYIQRVHKKSAYLIGCFFLGARIRKGNLFVVRQRFMQRKEHILRK